MATVLVSSLCEVWGGEWGRGGGERVLESMLRHDTLILELCCFGSVGHRSIRYAPTSGMLWLAVTLSPSPPPLSPGHWWTRSSLFGC